MGDILSFDERKQKDGFHRKEFWVCGGCGHDKFVLAQDSTVYCAKCLNMLDDMKTVDIAEVVKP